MKHAITFLLIILMCLPAFADNEVDNLYQDLPPSVQQEVNQDEIVNGTAFSLEKVWEYIKKQGLACFYEAKEVLTVLAGLSVLLMLIGGFGDSHIFTETKGALAFAICTSMAVIVYPSILSAAQRIMNSVQELSAFHASMLAVIGASLATGGYPATAGILPVTAMTFLNLISQVNVSVFFPMIGILFSLALSGAIYPHGIINGLFQSLQKLLSWGIVAGASVFLGILSIQKSLSGAGDSALTGAVKMTLSSAIPIVGGVMKDAYSAVAGSMNVIRTSAGVMGIVAVIILLLPNVIQSVLYGICYKFSAIMIKASGNERMAHLMENISKIWTLLFSISITETVFTVLSIGLLITLGKGTI